MARGWWYRVSFLIVVTIIAIVTVIPTFIDLEKSNYPVKSKINLGLDLQGGLYMVLGIDFKKVYRDELKNSMRKIELSLQDEGIATSMGDLNLANQDDPKHTITIINPTQVDAAKAKIKEYFSYALRFTEEKGNVLEYAIARAFRSQVEESSVSKSIEVIRNRIDEFGVTEPEIVSQGSDRIVVQLPGVKDIERAKELIGQTAKLEFKLVNDEVPANLLADWMKKAQEEGITHQRGERFSAYVHKMNERFKSEVPKNHEIVFQKILSKRSNEVDQLIPFVVESMTNLTGESLEDAGVQINQERNEPEVSITFNPSGSKAFEKVTGENIGRRLAIILDGNIYSDPVINGRIAGGRATITMGAGDYNELLTKSRDLSLVLRAGALPVELEFQEQRIVGPSLGADAIKKAEIAGLIGAAFVFIFIIFYYKVAGVFAVKTLMLNILFVLACLVGLEATLTLPGIAGIALTIGMAVDANIIIYERIKEELASGTPIREAVGTGFSRAFWTILDANLTTAAAGFCLLNFGTGPIRGFAITLIIGIFVTIYTAYFVSRIYFEWYLERTKGKSISI
jgi:protein-export membrane protein SecD